MKAWDFQSTRPEQNPSWSACYETKKTVIEKGEENQREILDCTTCSCFWLAEIITTGFTISGLSDMLSRFLQNILGSCVCKLELEKPPEDFEHNSPHLRINKLSLYLNFAWGFSINKQLFTACREVVQRLDSNTPTLEEPKALDTWDPYQGGPDRTLSSEPGRGQNLPGEVLEMRPASCRARGGSNRKTEYDRLNF